MKILAIGKNYVNSLEEKATLTKNGFQVIFSKPASSIVTGNKDIPFPEFTKELFYELELVLKIGKTGKNIKINEAASYISAIGLGIDYTAKDVMRQCRENKGPWELAKGFDGAAPISDFIAIENFSDLNNINFELSLNGEKKQVGNTALMIYNFEEIIAFISNYMTLEPGDLIFTGTPASGAGQNYKGDHLQGSLEGKTMIDYKLV